MNIPIPNDLAETNRRKQTELVLSDSEETLRQILRNARDGIVILDENCSIRVWNEACSRIFGYSGEDAHGRNLNDLLTPERLRQVIMPRFNQVRAASSTGSFSDTLECWAVCKDRSEILAEISASTITLNHRWHLLLIVRDVTERKKAEGERDLIIHSLEDALINVKTLQGIIPICSACKKIRNDAGYWKEISSYIIAHSEAKFSHGICPDCARTYFPEYALSQCNQTPRPPLDKVA